jgi:hypothetical protein
MSTKKTPMTGYGFVFDVIDASIIPSNYAGAGFIVWQFRPTSTCTRQMVANAARAYTRRDLNTTEFMGGHE